MGKSKVFSLLFLCCCNNSCPAGRVYVRLHYYRYFIVVLIVREYIPSLLPVLTLCFVFLPTASAQSIGTSLASQSSHLNNASFLLLLAGEPFSFSFFRRAFLFHFVFDFVDTCVTYSQPSSTSEMAEPLAKVVLDAVAK